MITGFPVDETDETNDASILEGLSHDDLTVGEILLAEFGNVYMNGYTEGSTEEAATDTFLLASCLQARYQGSLPDRFKDDYHQVERALEVFGEDPHTAEYLKETGRILAAVELFLEDSQPDVPIADQLEYIYDIYSAVVYPLLIKVGQGKMDIQGVIHEIESAKNPPPVKIISRKNTSANRMKALML
jgi:hypothetical protein